MILGMKISSKTAIGFCGTDFKRIRRTTLGNFMSAVDKVNTKKFGVTIALIGF